MGLDATLSSLYLADQFLDREQSPNCGFIHADLFENIFEQEIFDIVFCSGVLHHTENTKGGLKHIAGWAKQDGLIIVGLYNKFGRLRTNFRQWIFKKLGGGDFAQKIVVLLDPYLRRRKWDDKAKAWFQDQYEHPVETKHSMDEVLEWFDENDIDFITAIPRCDLEPTDFNNMFKKTSTGDRVTRIIAQILMLFSTYGSEGGLFIMIGRKRPTTK